MVKQNMDKDVISVLGKCSRCGNMDFIGKDNLCVECWVKSNHKKDSIKKEK